MFSKIISIFKLKKSFAEQIYGCASNTVTFLAISVDQKFIFANF